MKDKEWLWCPMTKEVGPGNACISVRCAWWVKDGEYSYCAIAKIAKELTIMEASI